MSDEMQVAFVARYEEGEEWFMATVSAPGEAMAHAAGFKARDVCRPASSSGSSDAWIGGSSPPCARVAGRARTSRQQFQKLVMVHRP